MLYIVLLSFAFVSFFWIILPNFKLALMHLFSIYVPMIYFSFYSNFYAIIYLDKSFFFNLQFLHLFYK